MVNAISAAPQTVAVNSGVIFNSSKVNTGCSAVHEDGSARFVLVKPGVYLVEFVANIAIPDGAVGPVSVALSVDGETANGTNAIFTPAALNEYGNVSISTLVRVYGACGGNVSVSVVNTSTLPISVQDANILIFRECGGNV